MFGGKLRCPLWPTVALGIVLLMVASTTHAGYVTVYGGPVFTSGGGSATGVNNAGTAVGSWSESVPYALRWDANGADVLGGLGTNVSGETRANAKAINDSGTAAGWASKYDVAHNSLGLRAVRWDAGQTAATELDCLWTQPSGYGYSTAEAINGGGAVVGFCRKYDAAGNSLGFRAIRWDASGTGATELESLGTDTQGVGSSTARGINETSIICGESKKYDAAGNSLGDSAVRWDALGVVTELEALWTDSSGQADAGTNAINAAGAVVGFAEKYDAVGNDLGMRAIRWDAGATTATELGHLGTDVNGWTLAEAYALNDAGVAVGYARRFGAQGIDLGITRAVRWDAGQTAAVELGLLSSDSLISFAYSVNEDGIAVGYVKQDVPLGERAVYWKQDGTAVDLNTMIDPNSGWSLTLASVISDNGWIAGEGYYDPDGPGGQAAGRRLFVMQIPEPASLSLLAIGWLALHRRWRV